DSTACYIHATHRAFEDLRQVASQLAGWLVLAEAGASTATPGHPVLAVARQLFRETSDTIRAASPPESAREHHYHLLAALNALEQAIAQPANDRVLGALRIAYAELQHVSRLLPG